MTRSKSVYRYCLTTGIVLLDALCVGSAMLMGKLILQWTGQSSRLSQFDISLPFAAASLLSWAVLFYCKRLYSRDIMLGDCLWRRRVVTASAVGSFVFVLISFALHQATPTRSWLILTWLIATISVLAMRGTVVAAIRQMRRRGRLIESAVVVGANEHGKTVAKKLLTGKLSGLKALGFLDEYLPVGASITGQLSVLGRPLEFEEHCKTMNCENLLIVPDALSWETFQDLVSRVSLTNGTVRALLVPALSHRLNGELEILPFTGLKVLQIVPTLGNHIADLLKAARLQSFPLFPVALKRKSREKATHVLPASKLQGPQEGAESASQETEPRQDLDNSPIVYRPPQKSPVFRKAAVFLDRDGVINENKADHVKSWDEFVFLEDAIQSICSLSQEFYVIVLTNQSVIGHGLTRNLSVHYIHSCMMSEVEQAGGRIDAVLWCPHTAESNCDCRKPKPGLLERAALEFNLDLRSSYFVGDAISDVEAALACGVSPVLVKTGRGAQQADQLKARELNSVPVCDSLSDAASLILEGGSHKNEQFLVVGA